jgi:phage antirepressor YoqD-like protein
MIAMFSDFELGLKPIKTFEIDNDWQSQKLCPPETDKTANDFWQTRR